MKRAYVFRGPSHRVKLRIFDFTNETNPNLHKPRPEFCVQILKNSYHVSTSFSCGPTIFYGTIPDAAWDLMQKYVPDLRTQAPRELQQYLMKWAIT